MTINDINKSLSQLAENPTRENVLDFSFALLHWMKIEPNTANKPQLLSPQTQKLKDFLATAPQTVQPQLYRISADNQNIRVRFSVLKKLKKEYISQLVDNDPGLSSYQSFVKGLTPQSNGTSFIPTQPYFIHFVTTPDYNKLVLIFNQGEQKRIVTFRNRLTNTQYNKIILAWQGIGTKSKPEIADRLWKSLDIKELNKEFYMQVKERFDALLGIVKTQHSTASDNQVKQFTVRLIGRYIFCWFLKEKGIIPHSLISKQTIESTDKYYQTVLLKLFFETLNTKVQDRDPIKHNKLFEKIPYLNGGLFDESEEDKLFTKLDLDKWLLPFVEILESYDFTVDESSSQYQQVAVDPEMLGRIFENLLASQNEETEKLANQRKAFGAFYTPREIVDYMVNESIKAFLQTQWEQHIVEEKSKLINNPEQGTNLFGDKKPQQLTIEVKRYELKAEEKNKIEKSLEPLFAANPDAGSLKKEEKNLLLNFLEQIKILDPACGSGAFPMGILHKLVELHEALGTVKSSYELKKDILSQNIYGVDIMPMAIEIARLRAWLSLVLEEDYKPNDSKHNFGVKPLPNLDFKFVCANSLIDLGLDAFIQESKGTLHEGFTKKLVTQLKGLEDLRKQFFTPALASTEKEKLKTEYLQKRNEVVAAIEADSDPVLKDIAKKIKHWNPFDDSKPSTFFSPTWMFGIEKGFDVVIGNPPYKVLNTDEPMLQSYKKLFSVCFGGKLNLYKLFFERSNQVLSRNGTLTLITPSNYLTSGDSLTLRKYLLRNFSLREIIDFEESKKVFENVTQAVTTFVATKPFNETSTIKYLKNDIDYSILQNEILNSADSYIKGTNPVIERMNNLSENLDSVIIGYQGEINVSTKKDYFIARETDGYLPIVRGNHISSYELSEKIIEYCPINITNRTDFKKRRIVIQEVANTGLAKRVNGLIMVNVLCGHTTNYLIPKNSDNSIEYLLGLINSSLVNYYFKFYNQTNHVPIGELKKVPIPKITTESQIKIAALAEKIISLKKSKNDTTALEKEIDVLVYKLYELTYDEVKIIDNDFWLSEAEYEKIKIH
jgi:methylase of polypeptide subunit release factors